MRHSLARNLAIPAIPSGATAAVTVLDLRGAIHITGTATSQSYSAAEAQADTAGAAYLDGALHSTAFSAAQQLGSVSAAWAIG